MARGDGVFEQRASNADSGRASASIKAVSRERFTSAAAADAVTPKSLCVLRTDAEFYPTCDYSIYILSLIHI